MGGLLFRLESHSFCAKGIRQAMEYIAAYMLHRNGWSRREVMQPVDRIVDSCLQKLSTWAANRELGINGASAKNSYTQ